MRRLYLDTEGRCVLDIRRVGAAKWLLLAQALCVAFALDDGPVRIWLPRTPLPADLLDALKDPECLIFAHNAGFDRRFVEHLLVPQGWPQIALARWRDTAAMLKRLALPASLDLASRALKLAYKKDKSFNIRQVALPRRPRLGENPEQIYWNEEPALFERLYGYCRQDVETLRAIAHAVPELSPFEQKVYEADPRINDRGYYVDAPPVIKIVKLIRILEKDLEEEITQATAGAIQRPTQTSKLLAFLNAHGCALDNVREETLQEALDDDSLSPLARQVIEIRLRGRHATIRKYPKLLDGRCPDGRIYHSFNYSQASTRRWSSSGIQVHNIAREVDDLAAKVEAVLAGDLDALRQFGDPLDIIGDIVRFTICAAPGHKLLSGDFSAIESRELARIVGETRKEEMWRRFDAGEGPEPYQIIGELFGFTGREARKKGKVGDLAFSYGSGEPGYRKFSKDKTTPSSQVELYKEAWRRAHPRTRAFWYNVEECAVTAIQHPGRVIDCGKVSLLCQQLPNAPALGLCLFITLPSGEALCYPSVRLFLNDRGKTVFTFMDNSEGQWREYKPNKGIWGGTLTNHIVQSYCRDLLAEAILRHEAAGRPVILHRHDSIICEVPL
jgi:DNA polymerase